MRMTVTEGLAEVKTIGKRIEKKEEFITSYMFRQEMVRDPFESAGGSAKKIDEELQAIGDLQKRLMNIRQQIQQSNLYTNLKIGEVTMTIAEWLTWRKEVSPRWSSFLMTLRSRIDKNREQLRTKGITVGAITTELRPQDVIINVDEARLAKDTEDLENTLGVLDGKLSQLNATTYIDV